jgi:hypothetical protein
MDSVLSILQRLTSSMLFAAVTRETASLFEKVTCLGNLRVIKIDLLLVTIGGGAVG